MSNRTCSVVDCERRYYSIDLCKLHYQRKARHGDPLITKYQPAAPSANAPCVVDGCEKPYHSRQMCPMHYQRWRKHGDANLGQANFPTGCVVAGCAKRHYAYGLCIAHHTRKARHGSATARLRGEVRDGKRLCSQCGRDLPVERFRPTRSECRTCAKKYVHARRALLASVDSDNYKPHELFAREGWVCQLCGEPIDEALKWPHRYSASVDHIIPLSLGGADTLSNIQSAHLTCNISKGARIPA